MTGAILSRSGQRRRGTAGRHSSCSTASRSCGRQASRAASARAAAPRLLALHDQPMLRGYVAGTLWLDSNEAHAAGSLRSALWRIRRLGLRLVEARGSRLELASVVAVDVRGVVAWARRVLDPSSELRGADVAPIWRPGQLLPDWYEDWVEIERERLRAAGTRARGSLPPPDCCGPLRRGGRGGPGRRPGRAASRERPSRADRRSPRGGQPRSSAAPVPSLRAPAARGGGDGPSSRMELLMESMTGHP